MSDTEPNPLTLSGALPEDSHRVIPEERTDWQKEVEPEERGQLQIVHPYDPSQIRIDPQTINLSYLLEKITYGEIDFDTEFQRAFVWDKGKQSRLIESILLGLPLPSFYFSEQGAAREEKPWVIVDGLQRLSTFKAFGIDKTLILEELEFLKDYEGKSWDQLSRADTRRINGFKINLYLINAATPDDVKYMLFKRVNTESKPLTAQEIRHALHQGKAANLLKELARDELFIRATDGKIPTTRQEDRDFVNRFIAFYVLDYEDEYEGELDGFLNRALIRVQAMEEAQIDQLRQAFRQSMDTCYQIFEQDAFRKRFNLTDMRKPISKAVFDTISVNVAKLTPDQQQLLVRHKGQFKTRMITLFNDASFKYAITTATAQKANIATRFEVVRTLIQDILS